MPTSHIQSTHRHIRWDELDVHDRAEAFEIAAKLHHIELVLWHKNYFDGRALFGLLTALATNGTAIVTTGSWCREGDEDRARGGFEDGGMGSKVG